MENQRSITPLFILGGVAAGLFVRFVSRDVMRTQHIEDPLIGFFAATTLVGVLVAVGVAATLARHERARAFLSSAMEELAKVTWPTREDTLHNTFIVLGAALGFGGLMFVYDYGWSALTALALYSGGVN